MTEHPNCARCDTPLGVHAGGFLSCLDENCDNYAELLTHDEAVSEYDNACEAYWQSRNERAADGSSERYAESGGGCVADPFPHE